MSLVQDLTIALGDRQKAERLAEQLEAVGASVLWGRRSPSGEVSVAISREAAQLEVATRGGEVVMRVLSQWQTVGGQRKERSNVIMFPPGGRAGQREGDSTA